MEILKIILIKNRVCEIEKKTTKLFAKFIVKRIERNMFVLVVLLTEPHKNCIVPEKYVFGLDEVEDKLKTWGVSKHNHLIFWTRSLLDDNFDTDSLLPPNFNLDPISEYPPPLGIDSACYIGRVKRFFSKLITCILVYTILIYICLYNH